MFRYGKPFQAMYEKSFTILRSFNTKLALDKVLVIGDSLETDILGANNNKLNSLLITNGIHKHELTNSNNYEVYKFQIDEIIKNHLSKDWKIQRLGINELDILRLSVFELCFLKKFDNKTIINEYVSIFNNFCGNPDFASGFLNKILFVKCDN